MQAVSAAQGTLGPKPVIVPSLGTDVLHHSVAHPMKPLFPCWEGVPAHHHTPMLMGPKCPFRGQG